MIMWGIRYHDGRREIRLMSPIGTEIFSGIAAAGMTHEQAERGLRNAELIPPDAEVVHDRGILI